MPDAESPDTSRWQSLREALKAAQLDALLVTCEQNVRWLTGFTGDSSWLLVTLDSETLLSDFRFVTQIAEECPGLNASIRSSGQTMTAALTALIAQQKIEKLGFEGRHVSVETHRLWRDCFPDGLQLVETVALIEQLRVTKSADEIDEIRKAVAVAEQGWNHLLSVLTPEGIERNLAADLEHALREQGAEGFSFPGIIAVGDRAALPHYRAGGRRIGDSPILLVDWGARLPSGYCSDLTRTVLTRDCPERFETVYKTVLEAQQLAIQRIAPGVTCGEVDATARESITAAGFGEAFDHGTGHGIGLDVHELPRLGRGVETVLQPGMVVTVEPGIYLPGWGGVRIEDDVLVTGTGYEVLSTAAKSWESVRVM